MDSELHATTIGSHVGADDLHLPGGAQRLRGAGEGIDALADRLSEVADSFDAVRPAREDRGFATRALGGLRRRTVETLHDDARQLRRLAEAVQQEADALGEMQGSRLEQMRQRWRGAKQALVAAAEGSEQRRQDRRAVLMAEAHDTHGGGGRAHGERWQAQQHDDGPAIDGLQLARAIEADIVGQYAGPWQRLFGWTPTEPGGPGQAFATMEDSELDQALTEFRHTVREVMEEWADAARRIEELDQVVERRVDREQLVTFREVDGDGPDTTMVSDPEALRSVARDLAEQARGIRQAIDRIDAVGTELAHGRMQPQGDHGRPNHRFERQWTDHLEELAERFRPISQKADELAEEMLRLDREGAHQLRNLVRD